MGEEGPVKGGQSERKFVRLSVDSLRNVTYVALTKSSDNRSLSARGRQIQNRVPGDFAFLCPD